MDGRTLLCQRYCKIRTIELRAGSAGLLQHYGQRLAHKAARFCRFVGAGVCEVSNYRRIGVGVLT